MAIEPLFFCFLIFWFVLFFWVVPFGCMSLVPGHRTVLLFAAAQLSPGGRGTVCANVYRRSLIHCEAPHTEAPLCSLIWSRSFVRLRWLLAHKTERGKFTDLSALSGPRTAFPPQTLFHRLTEFSIARHWHEKASGQKKKKKLLFVSFHVLLFQ